MNRSEFGAGIKKIQFAYNTTFDAEKLLYWWESLKNMEGNRFLNRIDDLIKEKKYIPNIADILNINKDSQTAQHDNYEQRSYEDSFFDKFYCN